MLVIMYDKEFYDRMNKQGIVNSRTSSQIIVPMVVDLFQPNSVVDVGCATGVWLDAFKKIGKVKEVLGYDGDWVDENRLLIKRNEFVRHNLEEKIVSNKKYDLAISLEVAEHISKEHANDFVESLVNLSDCIFFSAAIPFQGGEHHVNEQWQSYWIRKFENKGYICFDYIRPIVWNNKRVSYSYAQNSFIFIEKNKLLELNLNDKLLNYKTAIMDCVHPGIYKIGLPNEQSTKRILELQKKIIIALIYKLRKILDKKNI